ncbi:hypothetical protein DsansV1_C13g0122251 [Dioscorea sansibarensis]
MAWRPVFSIFILVLRAIRLCYAIHLVFGEICYFFSLLFLRSRCSTRNADKPQPTPWFTTPLLWLWTWLNPRPLLSKQYIFTYTLEVFGCSWIVIFGEGFCLQRQTNMRDQRSL